MFGIALEYHLLLGPFHFFVLAFALTAVYAGSRFIKQQHEMIGLFCLLLFATLLGSVWFYLAEHHNDPLEKAVGSICTAEGRIITVQVKDGNYSCILITAGNSGKRVLQVSGPIQDPAEMIGKWAVVRGKVAIPAERRNPGLFDYRLYLKTKGVRVILQCDSSQVMILTEHSSFLRSQTARLKYGYLEKLGKEMGREAYGLMAGMLFGDCSLIGDDVYEAFQKNGVAHILSVSGIHVGIVYLYVSRLLGNRKTKTFYLLTALMLLFYAALSEFSPSVVRSVVMIFIHMFSKVSYRRYDFMSCTCASALGMLMVNPFYLFNAGFQLSYMAVFCLASLIPWTDRKLGMMEEEGKNELLITALRYLSPLLIIQIGMAPMTAYLYNYFSVVSFLLNTPIIAISSVIIPLGICLIPVSFVGGIFFGVGAQAAELLTDLMLWLNRLFYLPGIGFFNLVSPPVFFLFVFYGFFFFLSSEYLRILYQRGRKRIIALCFVLIITISLPMSMAAGNDYSDADLVFLDVGQGDCLYVHTPGGRNVLIDGGGSLSYNVGEKILLPYLLKNGVREVDLAVATHLHDDHYLGLTELAGKMKVNRFGVYEANRIREHEIIAETGLESRNLLYLGEGDRISIEPGVWIDVMYPEKRNETEYRKLLKEEKDENRSSLILKVCYMGMTVLMTGDLGFDGEKELMSAYAADPEALHADVLKIGHHGSRYSTGDGFLAAVRPKIAVFQVGKNNFGHPHPTVIEKCSKNDIIIYRNDQNGAIVFSYDENENEGQLWHIKVLLQQNMHIKE
jgi:competence protein ComEC